MAISAELASEWSRRWDRQQEYYLADREERFGVVADVVEHAVGDRPDPVLVDLGCGPGTLSARLAERLPKARIVGADSDPFLLALAEATLPARARLVDTWIGVDAWLDSLGLHGPIDAAVSTTALHWPPEDHLARAYRDLASAMRPGAVFVNGDHMGQERPALAALVRTVRDRRAERSGVADHEDWDGWWEAATEVPEFAALLAEREQRGVTHGSGNGFTLTRHTELLHAAGFAEVGTVWQYGDNYVLVAVR